ncbi:DNA gyrase subunit A [Candidatus Shapirobacteria bacterium CG10_big_fil_rev_8_21_14_0_10_48_15]|uniref:DNA gyrase subunit A n=1 Tax=Candidatus Shapirobacteria bacterium CG10_big_fil_rev_8_21_14_0_10_48_15 TaxID=1974484 RepID=A0A2M8L6N1_9BACT|nr:MAG: DNA gyrase subunit A [Candidatus Shapirobacteria bacterium CG10_big_fil_rev_8_21_14_0_10_48_15]
MSSKIGQINPVAITDEVKKFYLDYAMSVIVARALPDVRDGLKPVHRRILYAMQGMNLNHTARYTKSAKIVGETMGKYHPHGDLAIYDALVRLAQDFSMRYPLIDGQGNFGSVDGDSPAAMRYTEARLAAISQELLADLDKQTVDFRDNFDASLQEPVFLPAKLPNLLLMGSDGIAVGMATKIPPHNLREVVDGLVFMLQKGRVLLPASDLKKIALSDEDLAQAALQANFESATTIEELMNFIKGPDFPTRAAIFNQRDLIQAYTTGRGKITVQAKAEIEETKSGKLRILVTEIPYQVNKADLISKIAKLVKDKKLDGVADLRDESDRHGLQIVIELKKTAKPKAILNNLYKHTAMRINYHLNMVALVDNVPQTLNLKQILMEFIRHRQQVVIKRAIFELKAARQRAHILEGLKIALDNLDAVIETIRKSADADQAKINLMNRFKLSEVQSQAILDMQLRRLAALERQKIEDEYQAVLQQIQILVSLLATPQKVLDVTEKELVALKEKYGDERRTKVYRQALEELGDEDLIPDERCLVTLTKSGYIKRLPIGTYRSQRRGGKGVTGMSTKETDEICQLLTCTTHDSTLFFTNQGRVFSTRVWDLPEGSRQSKGQAVINLINLEQEEIVQSILTVSQDSSLRKFLLIATKNGVVKKTDIRQYQSIRNSGLIAMKLKDQDQLCWVKPTSGQDEILLVSHHGKSIRFRETDARPMGRDTNGVRGIRLKKDDYVVGMEVFAKKSTLPKDRRRRFFRDILIVTEKGMGKRAAINQWPVQNRGGVGVKAANLTAKTGKIVASVMVNQNIRQILLTSKRAQVIKLPLRNIPRLGRDTQGVILMRFSKPGDTVAAITCLRK